MAEEKDNKYDIKMPNLTPLKRTPNLKSYFFLDGTLYRVVRQDRAQNLLVSQEVLSGKRKVFILSDIKRKMRPAYNTIEVAQLLNRDRQQVLKYIRDGKINEPVRIHPKGKNLYGHAFSTLKWSEEDIIALHDYLLTNGGGRPRKDGILYSAARIPSRKELLALLHSQPIFYMQTADGDMVPIWRAYDEV